MSYKVDPDALAKAKKIVSLFYELRVLCKDKELFDYLYSLAGRDDLDMNDEDQIVKAAALMDIVVPDLVDRSKSTSSTFSESPYAVPRPKTPKLDSPRIKKRLDAQRPMFEKYFKKKRGK